MHSSTTSHGRWACRRARRDSRSSSAAKPVAGKSTLAEQVVTVAVKTVVDALGGGYTIRKFYRDAGLQAVRASVLLAAARHLNQS